MEPGARGRDSDNYKEGVRRPIVTPSYSTEFWRKKYIDFM